MKTAGILTIIFTSMAATTIASPNALPMGVEVVERDGKTIVREVVCPLALYTPLDLPPRLTLYHSHMPF